MSKESGDSPVDEKLRQEIAAVEAKFFKVLTKEEYEQLIKLQVVGEKPPSPSLSTPDATGTQKKQKCFFSKVLLFLDCSLVMSLIC